MSCASYHTYLLDKMTDSLGHLKIELEYPSLQPNIKLYKNIREAWPPSHSSFDPEKGLVAVWLRCRDWRQPSEVPLLPREGVPEKGIGLRGQRGQRGERGEIQRSRFGGQASSCPEEGELGAAMVVIAMFN